MAGMLLLNAVGAMAQDYSNDESLPMLGLVFDDEAVEKIPAKPTLLTRDYKAVPRSVSLVKWAPIPKSQENYGTCTSWATTYAARTIVEAINKGWTDRQQITREAFAPNFVYTQIKFDGDDNCQKGSCIDDAMRVLSIKGAPKLYDFNVMCARSIPADIFTKARPYTIDDFYQVFTILSTPKFKIDATKKALAENRPVVIGMKVPESFMKSYGRDVWNKLEHHNDGGGHAMCVVGYDDDKYGGAFLIMNSWGTRWGNQGLIWVKYDDFAANVKYGFEMFLRRKAPEPQPKPQPKPEPRPQPAPQPKPQPKPEPKPQPKPQPAPQPANKFSGSMRFHLSSGADMKPVLSNGVYNMEGSYVSGTRYRVYLSNNEPAYVYVIGSDATKEVSKVFPPDAKTSPALVYRSNNIALPSEDWFIEMDDTKGTDDICVLYSIKPLDIESIMRSVASGVGTFRQRVEKALGSRAVKDAKFNSSSISFSAASDATVVPVFVAIKHV